MSETTLLLGDCLERMRELPDASVDAIITDPPYGIGYKHGGQAAGSRTGKRFSDHQVKWDSIAGDEAPDGRWLSQAYRVMKEGAALYLITRWDVEPEWRDLLRAAGFRLKQRLTWHKRDHGKGDLKGTWANTCEDILFASKGRHKLNRRPSMLIDAGCVPTWEWRYHPHQKPVKLAKTLIEASSQPGDTILDPFAGSGSTLTACLESGRHAIGIERDPGYFAICETRLSQAAPAVA